MMENTIMAQIKKKTLLSDIDVGGWAKHYATRPYSHYKQEIYSLFIDVLSCLKPEAHVLDIGAGPGHLTYEFYKRFPSSNVQFALLDSSAELLRIAETRSREQGKSINTFVRSFNMDGWNERLAQVSAIVSTNSIFNVRPERLDGFYRSCFELIEHDGLMLNQQSFAWEDTKNPYGNDPFAQFMKRLPKSILPQLPDATQEDEKRLEREKQEALAQHKKAMDELKASGS
jgi:cyclopropane fatty-acyl-phospholipid synthase-like methyltransferase